MTNDLAGASMTRLTAHDWKPILRHRERSVAIQCDD